MATISDMDAKRTAMAGRFCRAERKPSLTASPREERSVELGLKGLPAAAGLLRVGVGDAEARSRQPVLVIDDRSGEVNQSAILNEKLNAVGGKFLVTRLAGRDLHGVRHAGTSAGLDIDAQALVFRVGLADDFGDMPGGAFGQGDRRQSGFCHKTILKQALSLSMQGR